MEIVPSGATDRSIGVDTRNTQQGLAIKALPPTASRIDPGQAARQPAVTSVANLKSTEQAAPLARQSGSTAGTRTARPASASAKRTEVESSMSSIADSVASRFSGAVSARRTMEGCAQQMQYLISALMPR